MTRLPEGFTTDFEGLEEALAAEPSVSVRFNRRKTPELPQGERVPWCDTGLYLSDRLQFTFDPAFHQGRYYVQDASSMIYGFIVKSLSGTTAPVRYLDSCAAPGGKTTAAIDVLPAGSLVVANEYVPQRAEILRENLVKWGESTIIVSKGDTRKFRGLSDEFDIVAADVPCSGEGMFRKDAEAVAQWTPALVTECARRQREIVENLWETLRPGGYLIYSTCTFNREENEDMVAWIVKELGAEPATPLMPSEWGVVERDGCAHFLPGRVRGEGLTVAVLKKPGSFLRRPSRTERPSKPHTAVAACRGWIKSPDSYRWTVNGDMVSVFPSGHDVERIMKILDVIYAGVEVARVKGRDIVPSHSLAMSAALDVLAFPAYEADYATAIAYLRREAVVLDGAPSGFVLLTYKGAPLGFVKNLGRRANNLYPQPWRILSSHIPDSPVSLI